MSIASLAKNLERFTVAKSPAILTAIAVTGTVTTAVLASQASFKAARLIQDEEARHIVEGKADHVPHDEAYVLETADKVKLVWTLYIPAASTCITTIVAMIAATQIGTRRAAAMTVAYSMTEKAFGEYREKIVEKLGEKKEEAARDELAQERVDRHPLSASKQVVIVGANEVLCFDQHSGRYFNSSMEQIKKAQNDTNFQILNDTYASLNDFYERIGLPMVPTGEELGWNGDRPLDVFISTVLSEDQQPCLSIDFTSVPIPNFYKFH